MGEVWEARDLVIERRVAEKLLPHERRDAAGAELFFREARTARGLGHPGVVTVHDLGQDPEDGTLYLVMEYVDGKDLATLPRENGRPSTATVAGWAAESADALAAAHRATPARTSAPSAASKDPNDRPAPAVEVRERLRAITAPDDRATPPQRSPESPTEPRPLTSGHPRRLTHRCQAPETEHDACSYFQPRRHPHERSRV
jgi:serine/threonine protein kinase